MKYLERVISTGDFINSSWLTSSLVGHAPLYRVDSTEHYLYSDPIINTMKLLRNQVGTVSVNHASSSKSSWRTSTRRLSYQRGLLMFRELLFGTRPVGGNWRPFTRISVFGTNSNRPMTKTTFSVATGYSGWIAPTANLGSYPFWVRTLGSVNFITFADLRQWCSHLIGVHGPSANYWRQAPGTNNRFNCRIDNLTITDSRISYTAKIEARFPPYVAGSDITYSVLILSVEDGSTSIYCSGLEKVKDVNVNGNGTFYFTPPPVQHQKQFKNLISDDSGSTIRDVVSRSHHSILGAAAGLNNTQSSAITKMLGRVSDNFETLMESPGLPELLKYIITWPSDFRSRYRGATNLPSRIVTIIEAASKGYLSWAFAARPTLKSVKSAFERVKQIEPKYEASMRFSSSPAPFTTVMDFADLPSSLKSYLLLDGMTESQVRGYRLTLHSEVSMRVTDEYISRYFQSLLGWCSRLGIVPEPKTIWALQPWSFVFDWFIPMSSYIGDAQAYFASYGSSIRTLGHSVFIELDHVEGWTVAIYIRSDNTTDPIDHVPQAWNQASGIQPSAIPLAIITAIGFGGSLLK